MAFDQTKIDSFKQECNAIVTIQELLRGRDADFDAAKTIRLVRHADNRKVKLIEGKEVHGSLYQLYRYDKETFLKYQKEQERKRFENVDYIVSFIGEKGTSARFVGVYKVGNTVQSPYIPECIICDMNIVEAFEPLTHRVVIDWGKSTVSWCQDYTTNPKAVIRIDDGFEDSDGVPRFTSYYDTVLTFGQLKAVIDSPLDNPWHTALKSVNCIYLITDKQTGKHYVGSTYGNLGIFGRWQSYVRTNGHGDNSYLKKILHSDSKYAENHFQWSILEILPINITADQAVDRENIYKQKLMSRTPFGYNEN